MKIRSRAWTASWRRCSSSSYRSPVSIGIRLIEWAICGPDLCVPDGASEAILDMRLAFATRVAIHLVFLAALLWLGLATSAPVLLAVAVLMLAAEVPLARLVAARQAGQAAR